MLEREPDPGVDQCGDRARVSLLDGFLRVHERPCIQGKPVGFECCARLCAGDGDLLNAPIGEGVLCGLDELYAARCLLPHPQGIAYDRLNELECGGWHDVEAEASIPGCMGIEEACDFHLCSTFERVRLDVGDGPAFACGQVACRQRGGPGHVWVARVVEEGVCGWQAWVRLLRLGGRYVGPSGARE